jgi:predicted O-methyltransferase YrrM
MAEIAKPSARDLVRQLDLSRCERALDVGGGPGAYAAALAGANPTMTVHLLDLKPTLVVAARLLANSAVKDRVLLREGDYLTADYGTNEYDLILLSHVTHDEGEPETLCMLHRAAEAARPGGMVVVHDFMVNAQRVRPAFGALFALHLTVYTQKGRTYSTEEYRRWMLQVGLRDLKQMNVCAGRPNATQVMIGIKT